MADPNNIFHQRRSIRKFTAREIPRLTIMEILGDAMASPSAMRRDPWEFIVLDEKKVLADVSEFLPHGAFLKDSAAGIIVCGDINEAHMNELSYMLQDVSAAIQTILLSAEARGLGSCWLGVHPREERVDAIRKYFKLPENIIPVCVIALGFKAEEKEPETRFNPDKVHFNRY